MNNCEGVVVSGADLTPEMYERLALEMLAVQSGDFVEVKDAMRKIIESAPEGADVAFLLSRALAHAGDRTPKRDAPSHLSWQATNAQLGRSSSPATSDHHDPVQVVGRRLCALPRLGSDALVVGRSRPDR